MLFEIIGKHVLVTGVDGPEVTLACKIGAVSEEVIMVRSDRGWKIRDLYLREDLEYFMPHLQLLEAAAELAYAEAIHHLTAPGTESRAQRTLKNAAKK